MNVRLDRRMADRIVDSVLSGEDPGDIAYMADAYVQERTQDRTVGTFHALRYFIGRSIREPGRYRRISGDGVRDIVESEAMRIDRTELGEIIAAEFWSWSGNMQYDYIAEVSNVVADAVYRSEEPLGRYL